MAGTTSLATQIKHRAGLRQCQLRHNVIINMATATLLVAHDAVPLLTQKGDEPKNEAAAPPVEIGDLKRMTCKNVSTKESE